MTDLVATLVLTSGGGLLPPPVPVDDVVTLRLTVTDAATGAAVAADAPSITLRRPDGTLVEYDEADLTAGATGVWTLDLTISRRGRWVARGQASDTASPDLLITGLPTTLGADPLPISPGEDLLETAAAAALAAVQSKLDTIDAGATRVEEPADIGAATAVALIAEAAERAAGDAATLAAAAAAAPGLAPVQSVAGRSGAITLSVADVSGAASQIALAAAREAAITGVSAFTQTGTDAVARTVDAKLRENAVSVADFQADGAADHQAAFEAALATGRPVKVPYSADLHRLTTFINLTSGATLIGEGRPTVQMTGHGRAFRLNAVSNVTIKGVVFDGNYGALTENSGILFLQNATDCLFEDCDFIDASGAIFVSQTSTGNRFVRCRFYDGASTAIDITGVNASHNEVIDCEFQRTAGFGIRLSSGAHHNLIQNNRCGSNGIELIGVTATCHSNRIIGNHAEGTGDNGISVSGYKNVVTGNICNYNKYSGIYIYGRENAVSGNVCIGNGQVHNPAFTYYDAANINNYPGLNITGDFGGTAQNNAVSGNYVDDDQDTPTQYYGISLGAAAYGNWVTATAYSSGAYVRSSNKLYQSTGAGTSGATAPTHSSGTVSDGGVSWTFIAPFAGGTGEAYGNTVIGNRVYRTSGGATYRDATVNGSNTIITSDRIEFFGSGGINVVTGGFSRRISAWSALPSTVKAGDICYNGGTPRLYECTSVGGTRSTSPTHTTGTVTGADGIAWSVIGAGQQITELDLSTTDVAFRTRIRYRVMGTGTSGAAFVEDYAGNGSPEGVVTAPVGSTYRRADGGVGTSFYVKESGSGATGWAAK